MKEGAARMATVGPGEGSRRERVAGERPARVKLHERRFVEATPEPGVLEKVQNGEASEPGETGQVSGEDVVRAHLLCVLQ